MSKESDAYPVTLMDIDEQVREAGKGDNATRTGSSITLESATGRFTLKRNASTETVPIQQT